MKLFISSPVELKYLKASFHLTYAPAPNKSKVARNKKSEPSKIFFTADFPLDKTRFSFVFTPRFSLLPPKNSVAVFSSIQVSEASSRSFAVSCFLLGLIMSAILLEMFFFGTLRFIISKFYQQEAKIQKAPNKTNNATTRSSIVCFQSYAFTPASCDRRM